VLLGADSDNGAYAPCSSFHTKGHVRIIAFVPQARNKVARNMSVDTFVPCFRSAVGDEVVQLGDNVTWWISMGTFEIGVASKRN
jgi:hypothetical protein